MFSAMLAPLNTSVSAPAWPSTVSLPSPGSNERVVAGAADQVVVAPAAVDEVVAIAAEQSVVAIAADNDVVAGTTVDVTLMRVARLPSLAVKVSSPPPMFSAKVLGRPDVEANGAGIDAPKRTRVPLARDREHFRAAAAVDLGGVDTIATFQRSVPSPGFPDDAVIAGIAEQLVVAGAAGERIVAVAAGQDVVTPPPTRMSLPAPPDR